MRRLVIIFFVIASCLLSSAQTQPATDYVAKTLKFQLLSPPQPVPGASVFVSGNPGPATYYYWVVTQTSAGASSPAGPFQVINAPNTLSGSNFDQVNWTTVSGATSYDVLRTSTPGPPSGACNCAVATGVGSNTVSDQANALSAYTVNTFDPATAAVLLQNINGSLTANGQPITGGNGLFLSINTQQLNGTPYADRFTSGGAGTCASPWASASGTGGIAEARAASPNGRVHLRQGVYAITSSYSVPSSTTVEGDGWFTLLEQATFGNASWGCSAVSGTVLLVAGTNNAFAPADGANNINLQNLFILGPGSGTSSGIITNNPGQNLYIDNVMAANFGTGYNFNGLITHKFGRIYAEGDNTCMNVTGVTDDVTIGYRNFQGCGTAMVINPGTNGISMFHILSGLVQSNTNGELFTAGSGGITQIDISNTYYEANANYAFNFDGTNGVIQRVHLENNHSSSGSGVIDSFQFAGSSLFADFTFTHNDFRGSDIAVPATAQSWTMDNSQFKTYTNASNRSVVRIGGDTGPLTSSGLGTISMPKSLPIVSEGGVGLIDADTGNNINIGRHGSVSPGVIQLGMTTFSLLEATFNTKYLSCAMAGTCGFWNAENVAGFSDAGTTEKWNINSSTGLAKFNAIASEGTAASLTGTGACATITTQTGGASVGQATCTGTTGASTFIITPGITAPHGWNCANTADQTTRANLLQQTANTTTSCTLTATSITQNDVIVFGAIAF